MQITVSGASGFVGQYVLQELQSRNLDATALTRSPTSRLPEIMIPKRVAIDIAKPVSDPLTAIGMPDTLIHLAWDGLPNYRSHRHVETELPAQLAFLTSCIRGGLKRLVVTGTCYEYGLAPGELGEDAQTQPCTQYGMAKDMLRKALFALRDEYDFELTWLRLFYLYGDGQSANSLYGKFHAALIRNDTTFDMSGGEQLRDFLPAHEAARIIVEIALRKDISGIFNVCSGKPISVRNIVQSWIDASNAKIIMNLGKIPYSPDEPMAFWGSRARFDALFGKDTQRK